MGVGKTLLLVDDEPHLRTIVGDGLKFSLDGQLGELITAKEGEEACEIVEQKHPYLVLMDVNMPGMDGITACRKMREAGYKGHVILYSNKDQDPGLMEAAQVTAFLPDKTIGGDILAAKVKAYLVTPHPE